MLEWTHMGVTMHLLQETFSILSIWAERRAVGHRPRGIHLSMRSICHGRIWKCQGRSSIVIPQWSSSACSGRRVLLSLDFIAGKCLPSSQWNVSQKYKCATFCWNSINHGLVLRLSTMVWTKADSHTVNCSILPQMWFEGQTRPVVFTEAFFCG